MAIDMLQVPLVLFTSLRVEGTNKATPLPVRVIKS